MLTAQYIQNCGETAWSSEDVKLKKGVLNMVFWNFWSADRKELYWQDTLQTYGDEGSWKENSC